MKHKQSTLKHNNPFCETQQPILWNTTINNWLKVPVLIWIEFQNYSGAQQSIYSETQFRWVYWYLTQTFQWSCMGTSATGVSSAMFCQSCDSWLRLRVINFAQIEEKRHKRVANQPPVPLHRPRVRFIDYVLRSLAIFCRATVALVPMQLH